MTNLAEGMNGDALGSDVLQVPLGVVLEVVGDRNPDGLFAALQEVLVNESGNRSAFADTSAVA